MPIPTSITDLSTTAALNSPAGSDNLSTTDDYLRAIQGIIKTQDNIYTKLVSVGANIASAATVNLSTATGNTVHITGTTATSAVTMSGGQWMWVIADGAWPLTYHATTNNISGGADYTLSAGDMVLYNYDGTTVRGQIFKKDGTAVAGVTVTDKIQPFPNPTFNAGAMTLPGGVSYTLDFRSTTLGDGAVTTVTGTPAALVVPSGATLGLISAVQSSVITVLMNNAGTLEYAVVNLAGGNDLSETGLISTTAISTASDSANVFYSTTARTNLAYRVISRVDSVQTTSGTWAQSPTLVQGYGGQALAAMSSLGYGQTYQNVTASRALGTTYYNTTGKPIFLKVTVVQAGSADAYVQLTVNGVAQEQVAVYAPSGGYRATTSGIVPPNQPYSATTIGADTLEMWIELR
jgi:hypothetical protein